MPSRSPDQNEDIPSEEDLLLFREVEFAPLGTYKLFHALGTGVENDISQHFANRRELQQRVAHAMSSKCFIEAISIRLQIIDYWLRLYFVNHPSSKGTRRKKEFGALLDQCRVLGLSPQLLGRLGRFNASRIKAVHGYVIGTTSYSSLDPVAKEGEQLVIDVVEYVVTNSGNVVANRNDLRAAAGAITVHVRLFLSGLHKGLY